MIPILTIDEESVSRNWQGNEESIQWVKNHCAPLHASNSTIPLYKCADEWVKMKVFNEFKETFPVTEFHEYGYCDTEEALTRHLEPYVNDRDSNYMVTVDTISMDNEKYYKFGTYVNKDGIDTNQDYYDYMDKHPEMKTEQDIKNKWITFAITKLKTA